MRSAHYPRLLRTLEVINLMSLAFYKLTTTFTVCSRTVFSKLAIGVSYLVNRRLARAQDTRAPKYPIYKKFRKRNALADPPYAAHDAKQV